MTVCTNCDKEVEVTAETVFPNGERRPEQIVGGAVWWMGGGYAEFIDSAWLDIEPRVVLCHDCCLAVFRAIPGVAKAWGEVPAFWHPFNGDKPCCEFGWTLDESDNRSHGWNDSP